MKYGIKKALSVCCIGTILFVSTIGIRCPIWNDDEAFLKHMEEKHRQEGYTTYSSMDEAIAAQNNGNSTQQPQVTTPAPTTAPAPEQSQPVVTSEQTKPAPIKTCNHSYVVNVVTEATCAESGKMNFVCSKCSDTYSQVTAPTNKHEYESYVSEEATCIENGVMTYACKNCDDSYTEEIVALGHAYEDAVTKEPTCTGIGIKTFTCKNCTDSYTEEIAALGHIEGEWSIKEPNGMFKSGTKEKKCITCGAVIATDVIPSTYPLAYKYIGIAVIAVVLVGFVAFAIAKSRKKQTA